MTGVGVIPKLREENLVLAERENDLVSSAGNQWN